MGAPVDGVLPPRMPFPFIGPPFIGPFMFPFIGGRGPAEDNRGGGADPGGGFGETEGAGRC